MNTVRAFFISPEDRAGGPSVGGAAPDRKPRAAVRTY